MADQVQALPGGPVGAVEYTPAQEAEMDAIPSRQVLSDGTKNPRYNPKMDPNSDRWDAHGYFAAQEQRDVFVHEDPEARGLEVFGMSINGFTLPCYPGKRQRMPIDFVNLLLDRNQRLDIMERGLVSKDEDQEGALSLRVGGAGVRPFVRRVAD